MYTVLSVTKTFEQKYETTIWSTIGCMKKMILIIGIINITENAGIAFTKI